MTQMVAQFQMRRDQDKTKAEPDRRREMRKATYRQWAQPTTRARTGSSFAWAAAQPERVDRMLHQSYKTLSFFGPSAARSIDFGRFAPMFRFDAARYRNAIS
jgi:hypothetical protein